MNGCGERLAYAHRGALSERYWLHSGRRRERADGRHRIKSGSMQEELTLREAGTGCDFATRNARTMRARELASRMHRLAPDPCVRSRRRRSSHAN